MADVKKVATRQSYGETLKELGAAHPDVVVLDADLANATKTEIFKKAFPDRPVFTITGSDYQPHQRRELIYGRFEDFDNAILVCTQQSLSESISIDSVDYCFIAELHWNDSKMSQF